MEYKNTKYKHCHIVCETSLNPCSNGIQKYKIIQYGKMQNRLS